MTFTFSGTKVLNESIPLAMANGMEWMLLRKKYKDRFYNLYRFKRNPLCWLLWHIGAIMQLFKNREKLK